MTDEYQVGYHVPLTVEQMAKTIERQDTELTRLRSVGARAGDVEGITNVVERQRGIEEDSSEDVARAIIAWLKEGK